jgi:hypothetical protein
MEHFVSIITSEYELEDHLVESVLNSAKVGLLEDETQYVLFETDSNEQVLRVQLHRQLSEQESDEFAETLADRLFEMGYDNFDIEVSTEETEELPFDVVEDLFVFMKNDPMFYRRVYFPMMSKIADAMSNNKNVDFEKALRPVIEKAVEVYAKKFDLPPSTKKMFTDESRSNLINRIRDEETQNIEQGDY